MGGRPRGRADAGEVCAALAWAVVHADADVALAARGNPAMRRAFSWVPASACRPARDRPAAAVADAPHGWPPGTYTMVRRGRLPVDQLSADVRSRRRRTICPDQPTVAGRRDVVDAVSFPVTTLPADDAAGDLDAIEAWFRRRVDIEERLREAKPGATLRPLPSAHPDLNAV